VHGSHGLTRLLVALMKLPRAGERLPVDLQVTFDERRAQRRGSPDVLWRRRIGPTALRTRQFAEGGRLVEDSWPGRAVFSLSVSGGRLLYDHVSLKCLGIPLPAWLSPRVRACVSPDATGWHVDVSVEWRGHLICRYWGTMRPVVDGR
jgi:Domain of unknown function (DUF4166)